jgi:hypothetical protein
MLLIRILNLIAGIEAILVHGFTVSVLLYNSDFVLMMLALIKRELPVFGIVHDQVVVGVIV